MLYKIMELSDLFADACICDEAGELMLLSLHGRDTAINQLFAAFELGDREGGFSAIRLLNESEGTQRRVSVRNTSRLTKFSGRLPRDNLFGNLIHCWIYDPAIIKPDKGARSGWVLLDEPFSPAVKPRLLQAVWSMYQTLSPVPMLDSWQEVVLRATQEKCISFLEASSFPPIGRVTAVRVNLPDTFKDDVSAMVQARMIGVEGEEVAFMTQARKAAQQSLTA
jgi:hypothetical protein